MTTSVDFPQFFHPRYSVACIAVCSAAPFLGVTHWTFALDSLPLNVYLTYLAYKFYRDADREDGAQSPELLLYLHSNLSIKRYSLAF